VPDASAAANVLSSVIGDADAEVGEFVQAWQLPTLLRIYEQLLT
jgi:hypothetical protein